MSAQPTLQSVVDRHLCMGCGACAAKRPDIVTMVDTIAYGRRPLIMKHSEPATLKSLTRICPGLAIDAVTPPPGSIANGYEYAAWGPVLEIWEGYATDPEIRHRSGSGGVVSALALYCIEEQSYAGAVQVRARADAPMLNETVISYTREDVLAATASRYAPASPCERIADIKATGQPHVFIGKPCDIAGAARLQSEDPSLSDVLRLKISIFCAGTPSLAGTRELLSFLGVEEGDEVLELRYRGHGWPGEMMVRFRSAVSGKVLESNTSYESGWGDILQKHKQWRCQLCADHIGDHADLSVGDPWYRPVKANEPGQSLVVVRTAQGQRILLAAVQAGALQLKRRSMATLAASQPNLERTKGAVFGRCLAVRLMGMAAPVYPGTRLYWVWYRALSPIQKLKSLLGTVKRALINQRYKAERAIMLGGQIP